jgi:hypothetical protein
MGRLPWLLRMLFIAQGMVVEGVGELQWLCWEVQMLLSGMAVRLLMQVLVGGGRAGCSSRY